LPAARRSAPQSIERFGYDGAFLTAGLVALAGAALTLALRRLPAEERPTHPARQRPAGRLAIRLEWLSALPAGVWLATLLGFYINFVLDTYLTFFPIYAVSIGISLGAVGFLKSIHSLAATGIRFAAAGLFHFMQAGVVNHVCVVVLALATVALSVITNEIALAVVFAVLGTSRGLLRVTSATMVADEYKRSRASVGQASGVYNAGLDAGTMLGPPVAGALAGALDIPTTFRLVAVVLPVLYYVAWFAQRAYAPRSTPVAIE
jgi:MFS family permease